MWLVRIHKKKSIDHYDVGKQTFLQVAVQILSGALSWYIRIRPDRQNILVSGGKKQEYWGNKPKYYMPLT